MLGRRFDEKKFNDILECTGLSDDVNRLIDGVDTVLGERGTNLSGGQKARLGLSRALYSEADIYLFDDPLSAVDAKVGKHMFDEAICRYLKGKTRILVTHQVQYITPEAKVYQVNHGQVEKLKSSSELVASQPYQELEEEIGVGLGKETVNEAEKISPSIFLLLKYIWIGSPWLTPVFIILYPVTTFLYLLVPYWLTYWAEQDDRNDNIGYYVGVLGWIVLVLLILGLIRNNLIAQTLQSSSKILHNNALMSIVRFPSSYFDSNTTGAIMGKMSNDIMKMDELIP